MAQQVKTPRTRNHDDGSRKEGKRRAAARLRKLVVMSRPRESDGPDGALKGPADHSGPEGPMPSFDMGMPKDREVHGPGNVANVCDYILTIKDWGHGPMLDVVSPLGQALATDQPLNYGEETEIPLRGCGKSVFVTAHGSSVHGAAFTLTVARSEPRDQKPRRLERTVTIGRGDETDLWGYRFSYRPDVGNSSRLQVINGASGIPVDDFSPKSGRLHVIEDERSCKRITIVPEAVYTQSLKAAITVERTEGTGSD